MSASRSVSPTAQAFRYRLFDFEAASEIDLGALPASMREAPADVEIVRAQLPPLTGGVWVTVTSPMDVSLDFTPIARFRVTDGRRIAVDTGMDGSAALRWRLLGPAFGVLLHQRRILPLHATAVSIGGHAVGLVGASGAGKSTLAAFLMQRGHRLLIDDVCALAVDADGVWAAPGAGRLRLHDDARRMLSLPQGERLEPRQEKYEFAAGERADAPLRLSALFELELADTLSVERLETSSKLELVLRHTYCKDLLAEMGLKAANFSQCCLVAASLTAYRLCRPSGFAAMDQVIERLERVAAS